MPRGCERLTPALFSTSHERELLLGVEILISVGLLRGDLRTS